MLNLKRGSAGFWKKNQSWRRMSRSYEETWRCNCPICGWELELLGLFSPLDESHPGGQRILLLSATTTLEWTFKKENPEKTLQVVWSDRDKYPQLPPRSTLVQQVRHDRRYSFLARTRLYSSLQSTYVLPCLHFISVQNNSHEQTTIKEHSRRQKIPIINNISSCCLKGKAKARQYFHRLEDKRKQLNSGLLLRPHFFLLSFLVIFV